MKDKKVPVKPSDNRVDINKSRWRASWWIKHYRKRLAKAIKKFSPNDPCLEILRDFFRRQIAEVERPPKMKK